MTFPCHDAHEPSRRHNAPDQLAQLNRCIAQFDIVVYRDDKRGTWRLYGDINRMQDVVDSECGKLITRQMHTDFRAFFAEVDGHVADCLRAKGIAVERDPQFGLNVLDTDVDQTVVDGCIDYAYTLYRDRPGA